MDAVIGFSQDTSVETIVIAAQWWGYLSGSTYYYEDSEGKFYLKPDSRGPEKAYSALEHMLAAWTASGKRVYLVLNIPVGKELAPKFMVVRSAFSGDFRLETYGLSKVALANRTKLVSSNLRHAADQTHVSVIDPLEYLCDDMRCPAITRDGDPIYKDGAHLRPSYVSREVRFLDDAFLKSP